MHLKAELFLGLLATILVVVWAAAFARVFQIPSNELASWAQGIGTVAAIGATIVAANRQIEGVRDERRRQQRDQVDAIGEAVELALNSLRDINEAISAKNINQLVAAWDRLPTTRWRAFAGFMSMPVQNWPNSRLYVQATELEQAFDTYRNAVVSVVSASPASGASHVWNVAQARKADLGVATLSFWALYATFSVE